MKRILQIVSNFWNQIPIWVRKSLITILVLVFLIKVLFVFLIFWKAPRLSGELKIPGLTQPVSVIRDSYGVPHIRSEDSSSAYFALGYVCASDRLFQMEILRRAAKGELSEVLGAELVPTDIFLRQVLLRRTAEKMLQESEKANPQILKELDSFLEGINYFLKTESLPIEFTILGYTPKPFDRLDVMSALSLLSFSFAEALRNDTLYTILERKLPNRNVSELFPRHDAEEPFSIQEDQPSYSPKKLTENQKVFLPLAKESKFSKSGELSDLEPIIQKTNRILKELPSLSGSNSWVIGPSRSTTGGAILANDPHIGYSNPGTWYEVHLKAGDHETYGYHLPIFPFPLIAHNVQKAWALTMLENDDMDFYEEILHPTKPNFVKEKGNWVPVQVLKESIQVKGEEPREITIQVTSHGPILSKPIQGYTGPVVSLYWVFHHLSVPLLETIHSLGHCSSLTECSTIVSNLPAPGLNVSYADKNGNIAWWSVGRFPIRKKKTNTRKILNGALGEDDVIGYIPFDQNPKLINPPEGIILTANHLPTYELKGYGKPEGYWQESDRGRRIHELLSQKKNWTVDDMKKIQTDVHSFSARSIVPLISLEIEEDKNWSGVFKEALDIYRKFDGENTLDSSGATIFHTLNQFVMLNLWMDEFGESNLQIFGQTAERWNAYKSILANPKSDFWDDLTTPGIKETRREILIRSFAQTVRYLSKEHGGPPSTWKWKNAHKIKFEHPMGKVPALNLIFNQGPFSVASGESVINLMNQKEINPKMTPRVGPSKRRIIDLTNPENSWSVLPTGNSGNLGSPFYGDQIELFLNGEHRKIRFTQSQIEKDSKYIIKMIPK
ncbi:penicillin acylase family protein [Leptospira noguchii]|uniref:penicillin acylase family protein n=1 Tax=Leptospira noguchii TaxID=28182 RepID=UPI001F066506|nr:penicillin acylase family protein [Leptospira noguchii]MCH1911316.1 penicillin acylase family protein [Leptospira noguchii]MCH1914353.1 penicillin acylase family protein [Leptospira noguchii]